MSTGKNPFPSGGITRLDMLPSRIVPLTSQAGALARLESAIVSIAKHRTVREVDEHGEEVHVGKPELFMLRADYGAGKSLVLSSLRRDCENGLKLEEKPSRKAVGICIYQPLHALIDNPGKLLDILTQGLVEQAPEELRDKIAAARQKYESSAVRNSDEIVKKILVWRYCANVAITNGVDFIAVLLDEIEETVSQYQSRRQEYLETLSIVRNFVDRQVGPIVVVLGITPKAIDEVVGELKAALQRRTVVIELPKMTSVEELLSLARGYDLGVSNYFDQKAIETIFRQTDGNTGYALAALHWAWEEMQERSVRSVDEPLADYAIQRIGWKGTRPSPATLGSRNLESVYRDGRQVLERTRQGAKQRPQELDVVRGFLSALNAAVLLKKAEGLDGSLGPLLGERSDLGIKFSEIGFSLFSEPEVTFSLLIVYAGGTILSDDKLREIMTAWTRINGDVILFLAPSTSWELRRALDRICQSMPSYKGMPLRDVVTEIFLEENDVAEIASLANPEGSITGIKAAQKLLSERHRVAEQLEDRIRTIRKLGRTIPYRWGKRSTKEVQWGIYKLLAKRFTGEEFTVNQAIEFIVAHYNLDEDTTTWFEETKRKHGVEDIADKLAPVVVGTLEAMVDQEFASKGHEGNDRYSIPQMTDYEREFYSEVKRVKLEESKNPGFDDIKPRFFGVAPRGNNVFALASGMEGKGFVKCLRLGPRRFYTVLSPDERLAQVELSSRKMAEVLQDRIRNGLGDDFLAATSKDAAKFSSSLLFSKESSIDKIRGVTEKASHAKDEIEKLRLLSEAEMSILVVVDEAYGMAQAYSELQRKIQSFNEDLTRTEAIIADYEGTRKLPRAKAEPLKQLVHQARKFSSESEASLAKFDIQGTLKRVERTQEELANLNAAFAKELEEVAIAEKALRVASENFEIIQKIATARQEESRDLGLKAALDALQTELEKTKKGLTTGRFDLIHTESPGQFFKRVLGPKIDYAANRVQLLRRASPLLVILNQTSLADEIDIALSRLEKLVTTTSDSLQSGNFDHAIGQTAQVLQRLRDQNRVLERLATLMAGINKTKKESNLAEGVDAVASSTFSVSAETARSLRHLLEDASLVECMEIRVLV